MPNWIKLRSGTWAILGLVGEVFEGNIRVKKKSGRKSTAEIVDVGVAFEGLFGKWKGKTVRYGYLHIGS